MPEEPSKGIAAAVHGEVVAVGTLAGERHGSWSCTRCGLDHPAEASRAVRLRGAAGNEWTVVMCPGCTATVTFGLDRGSDAAQPSVSTAKVNPA